MQALSQIILHFRSLCFWGDRGDKINLPLIIGHALMTLPAHAPTPELRAIVARSSGLGLPHESIGHLIGISDTTLRKWYKADLDSGRASAHAQVASTLYDKAISGDNACLIFYARTQLKWAEAPREVVVSGSIISISAALADATQRIGMDIDGTCSDVPE